MDIFRAATYWNCPDRYRSAVGNDSDNYSLLLANFQDREYFVNAISALGLFCSSLKLPDLANELISDPATILLYDNRSGGKSDSGLGRVVLKKRSQFGHSDKGLMMKTQDPRLRTGKLRSSGSQDCCAHFAPRPMSGRSRLPLRSGWVIPRQDWIASNRLDDVESKSKVEFRRVVHTKS
jgi:hypothetical protein